MSQVTTHILDTARGVPAAGITVTMYEKIGAEWVEVAEGITDSDGRVKNLINPEAVVALGTYKMKFSTKEYFKVHGMEVFYPCVEIIFEIKTGEHYHIPLLLSPFGYTTYRGS